MMKVICIITFDRIINLIDQIHQSVLKPMKRLKFLPLFKQGQIKKQVKSFYMEAMNQMMLQWKSHIISKKKESL